MTEISKLQRLVLLIPILLIGVILDQWTKLLAIEKLRGHAPSVYLGNFFRLEYSENPGAFLSLGSSLSARARFWVFTVAVALFLIFALYHLIFSPVITRLQVIAFSLIISGGISNLIDRMFRDGGKVIDFMNLGVRSLRTGIFNVADVAIMVGLGLVLINVSKEVETPGISSGSTDSPSTGG